MRSFYFKRVRTPQGCDKTYNWNVSETCDLAGFACLSYHFQICNPAVFAFQTESNTTQKVKVSIKQHAHSHSSSAGRELNKIHSGLDCQCEGTKNPADSVHVSI
jgi:hypothetical protein